MTPQTRQILTSPVSLLAFGLGSGLARKAPGTFGTLAAMPFLWLFEPIRQDIWFLAVLLPAFLAGIYLCGATAKKLQVHDHPGIVWDEFVGLWFTFWFIPLTPINIVAGFLLFRLFDIVKPWPIGWLDKRVKGGFGIMIDDLLAAVYALILMQGINWLQN
ncbi:phosphatidylglycerophosphatase A family protein [Gynuella sunshinyii]|uniref:Phosphatidylglycerophosphatase A n=1 Tax=Gynuella sunshinyii YC6258 TaxID=1445510 RepID=A0A0C5VQF6_9GAMM|nr:phosphatidylglycerophosphatase A [Gynuella sunshinyii]AJQ96802.1 phosphatidylglycerophosphatase A-related protein [Gynuella sunshinyii YC6258]